MSKKVWLVGSSYHYELMDFITNYVYCPVDEALVACGKLPYFLE